MSNEKKLTIAIPTYNRIKELRRTLTNLIPQLDDKCYLMILDNNSDNIVENEISDITELLSKDSYAVIRHRVNIGADPNVFRCFELCETKWLWTLSDDDEVLPNAVKTIFQTIEEYPDMLSVNFYSPHDLHPIRKQSETYFGVKGLLQSVDSFGAAIFMSTNIYNMSQIDSFYEANHMVYSCASQWAILFFNIDDNKYVVKSDKEIVKNIYTSNKYSAANLNVISGFITFANIRTTKEQRKQIIKMLLSVDKGWISYQSLIKLLFFEFARSGGKNEIRFHLSRYFWGLYRFGTIKNIFLYILFYILSFFPSMTYRCLRRLVLARNPLLEI